MRSSLDRLLLAAVALAVCAGTAASARAATPASSQSTNSRRALPGRLRQEKLWKERILPGRYTRGLPTSTGGTLVNLGRSLRTLATLKRTFDHDGDELPAVRHRFKMFHPFGSMATVVYNGRSDHPFTGLFAEREVFGMMRLSLGSPPTSKSFVPGTALQLYYNGGEANAVFLNQNGLDGQQPDRNFFKSDFTSNIPAPRAPVLRVAAVVLRVLSGTADPLRIPVGPMAAQTVDGQVVATPRAPYELVLRPMGVSTPSVTTRDFREELADLAPGPMFEVHGRVAPGAPLLHIGNLRTTSRLVASEYGDKQMFFRHKRVKRRAAAQAAPVQQPAS
jgi:hypothetical protein